MPGSARRPMLGDLYRMGRQMEADRELPPDALRRRDHEIGRACPARDDTGALLYWLDHVGGREEAGGAAPRAGEAQLALVLRIGAFASGAGGMAGFLLAGGRALVNVPLFLGLFVILQFALCVVGATVLLRLGRGGVPAVFPLHPAQLIARRALPDRRYLDAASPVLRLLLLRYGQEIGALFALGAAFAFPLLLAVTDFSFVWGSTFTVSDTAVHGITRVLSAPWAAVLPDATVSPQVIAGTRFHPAQVDLGAMATASRRGWWPFLFTCLLAYTLLPRLLLWVWSLWSFRRRLAHALPAWPGASSVLARMRAPVVETRAAPDAQAVPAATQFAADALLLEWADALGGVVPEMRAGLPDALAVGLGSPGDDVAAIAAVNRAAPPLLLVAVKGWEPPMADLGDVLGEIRGVGECRLLLVPLPGRELAQARVADWRAFAAGLAFPHSGAEVLGEGAQ